MNNKMKILVSYIFIVVFTGFITIANPAFAAKTAPDSTVLGPHPMTAAEYRFSPQIDPDVLNQMTEVWAKVFYPTDTNSGEGKYPLVMMLHGNHATCGYGANPRIDSSCEYTYFGTCPAGYVTVPNHEGYDYLAKNLASWGMVVVSINANRGITCGGGNEDDFGLNLARGKLVLKHLSLLYQWSHLGGAPDSLGTGFREIIKNVDFGSVGLLGHSRGGEGVRAAYNLYRDPGSPWPAKIPGLKVKAIFEIGAVDGQTSRVLDANGTVWNQLLPMCDGDVSDLEGRYPFERMLLNTSEVSDAQKSLYEVWGANHNFFNTEWQQSDAYDCLVGKPIFDQNNYYSIEQQKIGLASVPAFFRSRLGVADPAFNQNFNPMHLLPAVVTDITQVDRDFTPSPGATETTVFEDFDKETGTNTSGYLNLFKQVKMHHRNLESAQRVAEIAWEMASQETFFEAVWASASQGRDIHDFATLDFRVGRVADQNADETTDFSIAFEDAVGRISNEIRASDYAIVNGPGGNKNPVLKTVRIPLSAFKGVDLTKIHSVRFIFNKTQSGAIYLANIRMQRQWGVGSDRMTLLEKAQRLHRMTPRMQQPVIYVPAAMNTIRSIRVVHQSAALAGRPAVEIRLASQVPFPVMDRLPVLKIGNQKFFLSRYSDVKELKELIFTLTEEQYKSISKDSEVAVINGKIWKFGKL
ncbi:MAG: hypothetical protein KIT56_06770 [Gammaproteobacteria bacterium]|nr:hypothetical protein [Gammaproteobacteria bacterium]MCW5583569.1 hypothetical protein [Gammaproteobacteria bacterium]